jgi:hypothetical protein
MNPDYISRVRTACLTALMLAGLICLEAPSALAQEAPIAEAYGGIYGILTTFVIDRQGRIGGKDIGYNDKATFEKELQESL